MIAKILDKNTIEVYDLSQFSIAAIMNSGQVFRYFQNTQDFWVVSQSNYARLFYNADRAVIECNDADYFFNYFDLATNYNLIKNELYEYERLRPAINAGGGIRILRGDFNEMVISFIISANNNIKRFTKTLNEMSARFGTMLAQGLFAFPTIEQLLNVSRQDFKELGCGYRAPYLEDAVQQLKLIDIDRLANLSNNELIKQLCTIKGVGQKVASCIALFCGKLHRLDIVPVDTHIKRALQQLGECDSAKLLSHKYAGVAQQYIFYYLQYLGESFGS